MDSDNWVGLGILLFAFLFLACFILRVRSLEFIPPRLNPHPAVTNFNVVVQAAPPRASTVAPIAVYAHRTGGLPPYYPATAPLTRYADETDEEYA